ncbi:hypothetical protein Pd630_LPD04741 [Rhodococcus opacus PD630]|uniref:hypothetical protein n=1 Tax=Rhodococcus opacus TaxID=37919 RepID=UPI0002F3AE23|nr:hypothetical protein [Rhodococcus opacus]AHK31954.1 hypothetical protein Pd630_LPD04741 [Rhodococcus opacus PD630]UDG94405.1 hypothetical protein K2Z90_004447 [Rhodococcus opacus PD630]
MLDASTNADGHHRPLRRDSHHDEPVTPRRAVRRADQTVRGMLAMTVWVFDRVLDGVPGPGPPPT